MEVDVNYLAVVVAAASSLLLGFVWYGWLFNKQYMHLMAFTAESMKKMSITANQAYAIQFIASLFMAYVLSYMITFAEAYMEAGGWRVGLSTGFWTWLGFIVPVSLGVVLWEGKSWKLWYINASYYLALTLVMGVILSMWK